MLKGTGRIEFNGSQTRRRVDLCCRTPTAAPSAHYLARVKLVVLNPTNGLGSKEPNMIITGVDFHPEFQQIASVDPESGFQEKRLGHREALFVAARPTGLQLASVMLPLWACCMASGCVAPNWFGWA